MTLDNTARKFSTTPGAPALAVDPAEPGQLDDTALIAACLRRDNGAWREFMRRFEPVLKKSIHKTVAHAMQTVLASDAIDDVIGDFYLRVVEDDMRKLRIWYDGNRKAAVTTWLTMIATGIAIDRAREEYLRRAACAQYVERKRDADRDPNRGAMWLEIEDRNLREPIKKRRNRKSRDDE